MIGLFCRISSLLWGSFAKETHNLVDPTNRSHAIVDARTTSCVDDQRSTNYVVDQRVPLLICATWLIDICDMTHSYVRHDSFICATWLVHINFAIDLFLLNVTTHIQMTADLCMSDMTHSYARHDSFISTLQLISFCCELRHTYRHPMSLRHPVTLDTRPQNDVNWSL